MPKKSRTSPNLKRSLSQLFQLPYITNYREIEDLFYMSDLIKRIVEGSVIEVKRTKYVNKNLQPGTFRIVVTKDLVKELRGKMRDNTLKNWVGLFDFLREKYSLFYANAETLKIITPPARQ